MSKKQKRLIRLIKQAQDEYSEKYLLLAIPGFMSKKFVAYCSMKEDMELILEYIKILNEKPSHVIESALSYSLIALYGKCFTDASKNSYPKLEKNIFEGNEQLLEVHNDLMELRHQFIAHRGDTESEIGIAFMIIPKEGDADKSQIRFSQLKRKTFLKEDLEKYETQMNFIHKCLMGKLEKTAQKLHESFLDNFPPEEILKMLMNNAK